jgi:DNA polymerase elongation subunit (family B)
MNQENYVNAYVDGGEIVLLKRVDGKLVEKRTPAEYVTYYEQSKVPSELVRALKTSENVLSMVQEKQWLRVHWKRPYRKSNKSDWEFDPRRFMAQDESSPFNERGIVSYEADVHPVLRHFVDCGVGIAKPKRCYIDLETDSRVSFARKEEMRILCYTIVDEDGGVVDSACLQEDTDASEAKLLTRMWDLLHKYDQVCAWNGDRFDFPVMFARSQGREVNVDVNRWLWLDHLMVFKRMNVTASESGDEKTSMRLQDVATAVLKEGKDKFDGSKTWQAWARGDGSCRKEACPGCGEKHEHSARECMRRYCLTPDHKVLGEDLRWRPLGECKAGDVILGFEENGPKGYGRQYRRAIVKSVERAIAPLYEVELASGKKFRVTPDHKWLVARVRKDTGCVNQMEWRETVDLLFDGRSIRSGGKRITNAGSSAAIKLFDVWEEDETKEAGWLAGMLDGEGSLSVKKNKGQRSAGGFTIQVGQVLGPTADRLHALIREKSVVEPKVCYEAPRGPISRKSLKKIIVRGAMHEKLKFLGTVRPERLIPKVDFDRLGRVEARNQFDPVVRVTPIPDGEIVMMETSTKTFVADGYPMHNCEQDTKLLAKIEKKTGYLELFFSLCQACGIFPDSPSTNPTHQVDGFMLRLGKERHTHFRTRKFGEEVEAFEGAFVMIPEYKGIVRNVHVGDFARLYPSIIITWNMSPETKVGVYDHSTKLVTRVDGKKESMREEWARAPRTNVVFDTTAQGILPTALLEMIRLRAYWNDRKASLTPGTEEWHDADRRSTAYKIAANSFFGVAGSPFSRYYDKQVGESITQAGVYLLKATIAEGLTFKPPVRTGYADTDSMFADRVTKAEFEAFVKHCNAELYPRITKAHGCKAYDIKFAYEKQFDRLVMTGKKRYAARYAHYKGKLAAKDSKPEIKGLEFKRGDTAKLARQLQEEAIRMLLGNWEEPFTAPTEVVDDYHKLIAKFQREVLEEKLPTELCVISKNITKKLPPSQREVEERLEKFKATAEKRNKEWNDEAVLDAIDTIMAEYERADGYKARKKNDGTRVAHPPHVQVALILKERGEEVHAGSKIGYVVVDGSKSPMKVIPASDFTGVEADRWYLWENLVWPPTERLLVAAFPDHEWKSWGKVRPKKPRLPRGKKTAQLASPEVKPPTARRRAVKTPALVAGGSVAVPKQAPPPAAPAKAEPASWMPQVVSRTARRRAVDQPPLVAPKEEGTGMEWLLPVGRGTNLDEVTKALKAAPGRTPVFLEVALQGARLRVDLRIKVKPSKELWSFVTSLLV